MSNTVEDLMATINSHVVGQIGDVRMRAVLTAALADAEARGMERAAVIPRFKVEKPSGSQYATVMDTFTNYAEKRYNIFKGDGWAKADRHAKTLNDNRAAAIRAAASANPAKTEFCQSEDPANSPICQSTIPQAQAAVTDDGYCEGCVGTFCTANAKCVAMSNPVAAASAGRAAASLGRDREGV